MKIRTVVAEVFHPVGRTDGHTDTTKLLVTFRNFFLERAKIKVRSIIIRSLPLVAGRSVKGQVRGLGLFDYVRTSVVSSGCCMLLDL